MAYLQTHTTNFGELISGTFRELGTIRKQLLIYLAGFIALTGVTWFADSLSNGLGGIFGLVGFAAYFVGQYWLYRELLSNAGMVEDPTWRVFRLAGMALLLTFPIYFAALFFVIPGIILVAKWIMAPAFLVSGQPGVFGSLGASWNASRGNTLPLSLAFTALFVIWFVLFSVLAAVAEGIGMGMVSRAISAPVLHILPLLLMGLSVTAMKQLTSFTPTLADVFE